ncbi:hypothetical protein Tco_0002080 [Tanacetum coccineum]
MVALPRCDELRRAVNLPDWEPMFILYCRCSITEHLALAREINALCAGLTIVIDERENFADELNVLVGRFVPEKMVEFMKEVQGKDIPNLMKLQILGRIFITIFGYLERYTQPLVFVDLCSNELQRWLTAVHCIVIIVALVNGKKIVVTEASVRRDLQLEDADGVDCLPNATIFEQLTLMGAIPTDPQYTPTITQPSPSQPQKKHKPRKPKKKDTQMP